MAGHNNNSTAKKMRIALIGCGKMGGALLQGWLAGDLTEKIYVLDPAGPPENFKSHIPETIEWYESTGSFLDSAIDADIFVMAVKPQIMKDVCESIKEKSGRIHWYCQLPPVKPLPFLKNILVKSNR